jgi:hypothetical protein
MTTKKAESAPATDGDGGVADDEPSGPSSPSAAEYSVAFSPRQVAVGLAIVAGLVAIAFRHRRSRDRKPADD